jgi:chemotaxis protein methyltransferase CheR
MSDPECVAFLQWALPRLRLRWPGYRRVRRGVCRRIARRMHELGLGEPAAYRARLDADPAEWLALDALCAVTISRFYRDRGVFERLGRDLLPGLAELALVRGERTLRVWSAGCACGEEPYSVAILFRLDLRPRFAGLGLELVATDVDERVLARARRGCYTAESLRDVPTFWLDAAFRSEGRLRCVREEMREGVEFRREDLRRSMPEGSFHLVLCRNLAFTYFDGALQREVAEGIATRLVPGGLLVLGNRETLPKGIAAFVQEAPATYRRPTNPQPAAAASAAPARRR